MLNWTLGQYIIMAFHEPKKYPKKPFSEKTQTHKGLDLTSAEYARQKYGKVKNGTDNR